MENSCLEFSDYLIKLFKLDYDKGVKVTSLLNSDSYISMQELLTLVITEVEYVPELKYLSMMFEEYSLIELTPHIKDFTNYKLFQ